MIIIGIFAFIATFLGGLFALRFKDKLHLIVGFSAGAVVGVAFFDLLPEALDLASPYGASKVLGISALGFVLYMLADRLMSLHSHTNEEDCHNVHHKHKGKIGAGSFSIHSFLDGVAIGIAFQVSPTVGYIIALAVLTHDFSDGVNTVSIVLKNGGTRREALKWLLADALAPLLGVATTIFFTLSKDTLGIVLALFSGFFLYIGASDLLPESHHDHPTYWTTLSTVFGILVIYAAITFAGI